ncbi:MAG: hypothetical protein AAF629_17680 [Chloroflexota bacterium]
MTTSQNPYIGPRPFDQDETDRFFGRNDETRILQGLISARRVVLLFAKSGVGKSSLLRAGLIPKLTDAGTLRRGRRSRRAETLMHVLPVATVGGGVRAVDMTHPDSNIFVFSVLLNLQPEADPQTLSRQSLSQGLAPLLSTFDADMTDSSTQPVLLIIDQFEELFNRHLTHWPKRADFFRQTAEAMIQYPRLRLLFAMREDFIGDLIPYADLLPDRLRSRLRLEQLGREAALQAVKQPALDAGRPFAAGVAETLVDNLSRIHVDSDAAQLANDAIATMADRERTTSEDVALSEAFVEGAYVEPVHLQVVCQQLWRNLTADQSEITAHDLATAGDVDQALTTFYESTIRATLQQTTLSERALRRWFDDELITLARTRSLVYRDEVEGQTATLPNEVADQLADAWLIRADVRGGNTWYELAHDRMVEPILGANLRWRETYHNPLANAYESWQDSGRDGQKLLRGAALLEAQRFADSHLNDVTEDEAAFLTDSQTQAERDQALAQKDAQRRRNLIVAGIVVMILLLGLAAFGLSSANQANENAAIAERASTSAVNEANRAATSEADAQSDKQTAEAANIRAQNENRRAATSEADAIQQKVTAEAARNRAQNQSDRAATSEAIAEREKATAEVASGLAIERQLTAVAAQNTAVAEANRAEVALQDAKRQSQISLAQSLAALAPRTDNDNQLTTLLALEAYNVNQQVQGGSLWLIDNALRQVLAQPYFNNTQRGHNSLVSSVTFSPDGKWLASGSDDRTIRLWNLDNENREAVVLGGHADSVWSVAFSLDGKWLASGSDDNTVRLWNLDDAGVEAVVLSGHDDNVLSVAFSPDGKWLASGSDDNTVRLWNLDDAAAEGVVLSGHDNNVLAVAFSPDEKWLASGSADNTIRLWKLDDVNGETVVLTGHNDLVRSVAFSLDGKWLASGGYDGSIRLWDLDNVGAEATLLSGDDARVLSVAFSADGKWLASGSDDDTIRLWNLDDATANAVMLTGHNDWVRAVAFSADGKWLASGSADDTIRLWDLDGVNAETTVLTGHNGWVRSVAFSPDEKWLASGSEDNTIRLWNMDDMSAEARVLGSHDDRILTLAFSPDGKQLASGSTDNTVRLWDLDDASAEVVVLDRHDDWVFSLAFSPDGKSLVSGSADNTIRLWDLDDVSAEPRVLRGHDGWVRSVAFSSDGKRLASGSADKTIRLWDLDDVNAEALVLTGHGNRVLSVVFSSDGRQLASGSSDKTIRLWNLDDVNAEAVTLTGHDGLVLSVAFSPDGKQLASGSDDNTIRLWKLDNVSAEAVVLRGHDDWVLSVAFSLDGKWLASGSADDTIHLWLYQFEDLADIACQAIRRNLSWDEWQRYMPPSHVYNRTCPNLPKHPSVIVAGK